MFINKVLKVSIVTVVYNAIEEFEALINSVESINRNIYELVVVFNGGSEYQYVIRNMLLQSSINYKLIECNNFGFAHGCNVGVRAAKFDCIWLLNSDCTITTETISEMLDKYRENPSSLIGSKIIKQDGSIQCLGGGCLNFTIGYQKQIIDKSKLDYITGASLMISKENYFSLGMIDENFFLYWEETDFCMKARSYGLKLLVADKAIVYHRVGASTDISSLFTEYYSTRNSIAFFKRYSTRLEFITIVISNVIIKVLNRIVRRQFSRVPIILSAIYDGCIGNLGVSKRNLSERS